MTIEIKFDCVMVVCFQTLSFSKIDNHVLFFKISLQNSFFTNHLTTLIFRNRVVQLFWKLSVLIFLKSAETKLLLTRWGSCRDTWTLRGWIQVSPPLSMSLCPASSFFEDNLYTKVTFWFRISLAVHKTVVFTLLSKLLLCILKDVYICIIICAEIIIYNTRPFFRCKLFDSMSYKYG